MALRLRKTAKQSRTQPSSSNGRLTSAPPVQTGGAFIVQALKAVTESAIS